MSKARKEENYEDNDAADPEMRESVMKSLRKSLMKSIVTGDDQGVKRSQSVERMPLIIEEEEEERGRVSDKLIDAEDIEKSEDDSFTEDEDLREEMKE